MPFATQLAYTAQILEGFQSSPYRSVILGQGLKAQEHHPDNRARQSIAARGNFYVRPIKLAIRASARVYRDTRDKGESRFAREVLSRLTAGGFTFTKTGKIVPRDYGVLNPRYNPIVEKALVEAFTISSQHDRIRASDPKWRWKVARLLADSVQVCAKE